MICAATILPGQAGAALPRPADMSGCRPCWEKLDRTGWAAGLAFHSHGASLGVRVSDPAIWDQVAALLPPESVPAVSPLVETLYSVQVAVPRPGVRPYHLVYRGIAQIARTRELDKALAVLESNLHAQTAESAADALFVHAGVAAWRGQAIIIPGRSFSGKTTLTAALVQAGAEYLSDEYAVFGADGLVYPYPKTLSFRDSAGEPLEKRTVESLGGRAASPPPPGGRGCSPPRPGAPPPGPPRARFPPAQRSGRCWTTPCRCAAGRNGRSAF